MNNHLHPIFQQALAPFAVQIKRADFFAHQSEISQILARNRWAHI